MKTQSLPRRSGPVLAAVILPLFVLLASSQQTRAQVSIAPTILFIHDNGAPGELYLTNSSREPQEVNISAMFGYPVSEPNGNIRMEYNEQMLDTEFRLDGSMRIFPRRLVLQPGQTQVIRLQILPMRDAPDGVYFTRLIVASTAVSQDVETVAAASGAIGTRLNYVLEQSLPIFFRKGQTTTGVDVHQISVHQNGDDLLFLPHLSRTGNSPFMGTINARLTNSSGEVVASSSRSAYLYFEEWRRIEMETGRLPAGVYRLDLEFETRRNDIPPNDIVQAPNATFSTTLQIQ